MDLTGLRLTFKELEEMRKRAVWLQGDITGKEMTLAWEVGARSGRLLLMGPKLWAMSMGNDF